MLAPMKALWNCGLLASAALLAPLTFSLDAVLVFLVTTYTTLLLGHSVGMHRRVIHKSFDLQGAGQVTRTGLPRADAEREDLARAHGDEMEQPALSGDGATP